MARIAWTLDARSDLQAIVDYVAVDSPLLAELLAGRIVAAVESLSELPLRGRVVPEIRHSGLRELIFQNYRLVYIAGTDVVTVIAILHAAMDVSSRLEQRGWEVY